MRISDWSSDVCSSDLLASPGACPSIGSSPCSSDEPPAKRAPPTDASALRSAVGPLSARMYQPSAASGRLAVHLLRPVSEPILERRINHGEEPRSLRQAVPRRPGDTQDRKNTRLNSSH